MFEFGSAGRARRGERISGDLHLVVPQAGGALLAVIDGLGHGTEAASAAHLAAATLLSNAHEPLPALIERCHAALQGTRGAVLSLVRLGADGGMQWVGVGNVEGVLLRADASARPAEEHIPLRGGVVGFRLPALRAANAVLAARDLLVLATDGITPEFNVPRFGHPQQIAEQILEKFSKGDDDALVLVARLGEERR